LPLERGKRANTVAIAMRTPGDRVALVGELKRLVLAFARRAVKHVPLAYL